MSAGSTIEKPDYSEAKIVVAMVGLPARGKSYLSNKLQRYLLVRNSLDSRVLSTDSLTRLIEREQWLEYDVGLIPFCSGERVLTRLLVPVHAASR